MTTRALFNLLMVTALAYAARSFVPTGETITGSGAALAFGFLLIAALQIGHLADAVRFPQLTGYLLCGLLFGPDVLRIVSTAMIDDLRLIEGTAVGLIALLAGCELNFRRLRPAIRGITSVLFFSMAATALGLWALFFGLVSAMPATASYGAAGRAAIALVAANVLTAYSPAVVVGLISETRASGPLSELCMSVVVLADLAMVLTFPITGGVIRALFPQAESAAGAQALLQHIFGSIAVGLLMGMVLALYIRRVRSRTGLVIFALLFIVAEAGRAFQIDPLVAGLTAGLLLENASPVSGEEVVRATEAVTVPTFAIFFAVIGAEIDLHSFLRVAPFAVAAALVRAGGIFGGTHLAARVAGLAQPVARLVPYGLLSQAGVAVALSLLVLKGFHPWGEVMGTLFLGSIVVNQLVGPVLFRIALAKAGEIGAEDGAPLTPSISTAAPPR